MNRHLRDQPVPVFPELGTPCVVRCDRTVVRPLETDPALKSAYEAWSADRTDFNARLGSLERSAVEEGWQRHYLRGEAPAGEKPTIATHKRM